jgi:hypothetical protein
VATVLLTGIRLKPERKRLELLVALFVTLISGAAFGFSASLLVDVLGGTTALMVVA